MGDFWGGPLCCFGLVFVIWVYNEALFFLVGSFQTGPTVAGFNLTPGLVSIGVGASTSMAIERSLNK